MVFFRSIALLFASALFALSCLQVVTARPGFNLLHYVMIEGVPVLVSGSEHIPVPTGTVLVDGGTPIPTLSPSPAVSAEPTAIALNVQTDTISVASVLVTSAASAPSDQPAQPNYAIRPLATTGFILIPVLSILYQLV